MTTTPEEMIENITWQERFDAALEATNTDGGFIYDLGEEFQGVDFDTDAIKEFIHQELQKARAHELEVLAVHLDRQLSGYTSVSLDSIYRYIEERQKAIQAELERGLETKE